MKPLIGALALAGILAAGTALAQVNSPTIAPTPVDGTPVEPTPEPPVVAPPVAPPKVATPKVLPPVAEVEPDCDFPATYSHRGAHAWHGKRSAY
jgi:hypothetical protein